MENEKNNILYKHYPSVYPKGEDPAEWNTPSTDSFDRFLHQITKSAQTRDIIRHRGENGEIGGDITTASDDQVADWTGLDASNIGRRVNEDSVFAADGCINVQRGKPRRAGYSGEATVYGFSEFFERWQRFIESENKPPSEFQILDGLQAWKDREKITFGHGFDRDGIVRQALADVEERFKHRLLKQKDRRHVVERAIELARAWLAQRARPPAPEAPTPASASRWNLSAA
jgi:hypothetical protein